MARGPLRVARNQHRAARGAPPLAAVTADHPLRGRGLHGGPYRRVQMVATAHSTRMGRETQTSAPPLEVLRLASRGVVSGRLLARCWPRTSCIRVAAAPRSHSSSAFSAVGASGTTVATPRRPQAHSQPAAASDGSSHMAACLAAPSGGTRVPLCRNRRRLRRGRRDQQPAFKQAYHQDPTVLLDARLLTSASAGIPTGPERAAAPATAWPQQSSFPR